MKKKDVQSICVKTGFVVLSLAFSSCRSTDTDHNLSGGMASVKINMQGSAFDESGNMETRASADRDNKHRASDIQRKDIPIDKDIVLSAEFAPAGTMNNAQALLKGSPQAVTETTSLKNGIIYKVVVYDSWGKYVTERDYTRGKESSAEELHLSIGNTYTFVAYSMSSTTSVPPVVFSDPGNKTLDTSTLSLSELKGKPDTDLMYFKKEMKISGSGTNYLDIILKHKFSQITVKLDASALGKQVNKAYVNLEPHYKQADVKLSDGSISRPGVISYAAPSFPELNKEVVIAEPAYMNISAISFGKVSFAYIKIGDTEKFNLDAFNNLNITPGVRYNLTLNFKNSVNNSKCGAYLGPNRTLWKAFMCHNLGADMSADPFTPAAAVHGAKYQWGAKTGEAGRYYSQADDQKNPGAVSGWISTGKPIGSWSEAIKTDNDPCPAGYRVPIRAQWLAVMSNNNVEREGSWISGNYASALYFTDASNGRRTLMLPAAGSRLDTGGTLSSRGDHGRYWSASEANFSAFSVLFNSSGVTTMSLYLHAHGFSVRCVAE